MPSLLGFKQQFGISSSAGAGSTRNFVSLVYLGDAAGAVLSFFINDRIGRLWSYRLYAMIWIIGQMIATASPGTDALYASRIVSGLGIGALSVTGPISIVELAPSEIRGLLTAWFSVCMGIALMVSTFCVYGIGLHVAASPLQYRIVMFSPCIFMFLWVVASFFLCESPRWLLLSDQREKAISTLTRLRCLPLEHERVQGEFRAISESIQQEVDACDHDDHSPSKIVSIAKETFTVRSNLRRLQQVLILYILPQLSGGNSVTNYFIPILEVAGVAGDSNRNLFLNGMYTMSKFFFSLFASFFFIDALGRRNSLFTGVTLQMLSDIYLAVYIKVQQQHTVPAEASNAGLAAIFIHSFGYTIGKSGFPQDARHSTNGIYRSPDAAVRLWGRTMAQPHPVLWSSHLPGLPLALPLRHVVCPAVTAVTHQQLGCLHLLRSLVLRGTALRLPAGPGDRRPVRGGNRPDLQRALEGLWQRLHATTSRTGGSGGTGVPGSQDVSPHVPIPMFPSNLC